MYVHTFQLLEYQWRECRFHTNQLPARAIPLLFMTEATSMCTHICTQDGDVETKRRALEQAEEEDFGNDKTGLVSWWLWWSWWKESESKSCEWQAVLVKVKVIFEQNVAFLPSNWKCCLLKKSSVFPCSGIAAIIAVANVEKIAEQ